MTGRAVRRAVEVGVRKASGAYRHDLMIQFLGESIVYAAAGMLCAIVLVLIILLGAFQDSTAFNGRFFGLTVIVCVIAYSAAQMISSMRLSSVSTVARWGRSRRLRPPGSR